jgi:ketopantoate hydroxymethyltransferase
MHLAFQRGGRKAIDKVMKQQPAVFLKLLVLLVPRELKVEHTGGVKAMSDEQLEAGIEAITAMLAARDAGANAKVIEAVPEPAALPAPSRKPRRGSNDLPRRE